MNYLAKPQVLVDSVYGVGRPGTFHFRELIEEVSNGVYEAGGKPAVFAVSDIRDGVIQATSGMSYTRDAFENAIVLHAAVCGSTTALLHLPVIAREAGVDVASMTSTGFTGVRQSWPT